MFKNVASQIVGAQMVATDGSNFTGSVTVYVTVDNGTQTIGSVGSGVCSHKGNGLHNYVPSQAETNGNTIQFTFIGTGAVSQTLQFETLPTTGVVAPAVSGRTLAVDASGQVTAGSLANNVITAAALATDAVAEIVDGVWDEVLTGATHNVASSAGRRLRQLASVIVHSGTAQGAGTGNNQIQLDTGASSTNGAYDPSLVFIESGTGAGQCRLILQYNGTTKVATVDRDWRVNPDNTSEFVIVGDAGRESVNEGLAQAGTSTTITLNTNAASTDDAYNGQLVFIRSGTGQDQVALIEDYVGSTKVATIRTRTSNGQWATTPDTTSAYVIVPNLTWTISEIQSGLATSANQTIIIDGIGYTLAQVQGAVSSPQTSTPAYATSFNGSTYTVTHTGVTSTGVRGTATRAKT